MLIKNYLENNKDDIFEMRLKGETVRNIANKYNVNEHTMSSFLNTNNIHWRHKMTDEIKYEMLEKYLCCGSSIKELAKEYHYCGNTISNIFKEMGIPIRDINHNNQHYYYNEKYFDDIVNQDQAYILGLLYADGSINTEKHYVVISLQESDVDILNKINNCIQSDRPLKFLNLSKKNNRHKNQYMLRINGVHIVEALVSYGLKPNKDFTLSFPETLSNCLYSHFIRGLMDGDGCILKTEKRITFSGSQKLVEQLGAYLENELHIHCGIGVNYHNKDSYTRVLRISGGLQVKKFLDFIYKDANLFIDRKFQIYKSLYC